PGEECTLPLGQWLASIRLGELDVPAAELSDEALAGLLRPPLQSGLRALRLPTARLQSLVPILENEKSLSLERLELRHFEGGDDAVGALLSRCAGTCQGLRTLGLTDGHLTVVSVRRLATCAALASLESLDLSKNPSGDECAGALVGPGGSLRQLRELRLD